MRWGRHTVGGVQAKRAVFGMEHRSRRIWCVGGHLQGHPAWPVGGANLHHRWRVATNPGQRVRHRGCQHAKQRYQQRQPHHRVAAQAVEERSLWGWHEKRGLKSVLIWNEAAQAGGRCNWRARRAVARALSRIPANMSPRNCRAMAGAFSGEPASNGGAGSYSR